MFVNKVYKNMWKCIEMFIESIIRICFQLAY